MTRKLQVQSVGEHTLNKLDSVRFDLKLPETRRAEVIQAVHQVFDAILTSPARLKTLSELVNKDRQTPEVLASLPSGAVDYCSFNLKAPHDGQPAQLTVNLSRGGKGPDSDLSLAQVLERANQRNQSPEDLDALFAAALHALAPRD